jgi:glycosyltransferase involved in cell wall biosynthesis
MDKPLVSGIIIFLNAEKFIEEAIESVFAQIYENWELLLVDDGSSDRSTEIARRYAAQYPEKVKYLEHPGHGNRGMSAARNLGVRHAQGKYVAFLDADDVWLPHKLQQQVTILESIPEAAMMYGRTLFWRSWTGKPEDIDKDWMTDVGVEWNTLIQPPTLVKLFLEKEGTVASTCSVLIRREVFEKYGGFEDEFRTMYEDMVFYTKVFLHEPVFVSGQCWDKYRQHKENSCSVAIESGVFNPYKLNPARRRFLQWVEAYLSQQGAEGTDVWQIVQQQLIPYRHRLRSEIKARIAAGLRLVKRTGKGVLRAALPSSVLDWFKLQRQKFRFEQHKHEYISQVGWVDWGHLRRVTPLSRDFGFDRGKPVDRYYIEKFLAQRSADIRGRVLEIGDNSYTRQFGGDRVTQSDVLHVYKDNPAATIVGDLTCADHIPSDTFDCIILTQTLPFIYDVRAAIATIYRILKPGGVLLTTFAGISQISRSDMDSWGEYWRFTTNSARKLFAGFFPSQSLDVTAYGNVFAVTAFLHGLATEELRQEELDYCDPDYEMLITVRAVKSEVNSENTWSQSDTTVRPSLSQQTSARVADPALSSRG